MCTTAAQVTSSEWVFITVELWFQAAADGCVFVCSFKLDGDDKGWLEINPATGEIKTKTKMDRETMETFVVTVTAFEKSEWRQNSSKLLQNLDLRTGREFNLVVFQVWMIMREPKHSMEICLGATLYP